MLAPVSPVVSIFCDLCMMIIHDLGGPVILKLSNDEQPKGMPQDTRLVDTPNKRMSQEQESPRIAVCPFNLPSADAKLRRRSCARD